ncbi:hypothetical protein SCHPADRAFT_268487 [Schizopora paradoxa]|uniref:Uncharacterized protein n=1 Tax=Schizopora paradoxa TaxID=27342 RepID=A0A0H2RUN8_9AGAM|nr:hypothetical protein SCHPADRAFT_268487 [Schizopora paradoxa]
MTRYRFAFIFLCFILPVLVVPVGVLRLYVLETDLLLIYNIVGLFADSIFFIFIVAHAYRTRPTFRSPHATRPSSLGKLAGTGTDMISLMVTDSVKYYSLMVVLYVLSSTTFAIPVRICNGASEDCKSRLGIQDNLGIVTMTAILSGILAPRLLLNIRREYYISNEEGQGAAVQNARRSITWRVAAPGRPAGHVETFELLSSVSRDPSEEYSATPGEVCTPRTVNPEGVEISNHTYPNADVSGKAAEEVFRLMRIDEEHP